MSLSNLQMAGAKLGGSVATSQDSEGIGPTPTRGAYRPPMKVSHLEKTQRHREEAQRNAMRCTGSRNFRRQHSQEGEQRDTLPRKLRPRKTAARCPEQGRQ